MSRAHGQMYAELVREAMAALRANPVRAMLTTLGVVIGVLAVIVLVSLGEGARDSVAESFSGLGVNIVQVLPGKRETQGPALPISGAAPHKLTLEDVRVVRQRAVTVDGVAALLMGSGPLRHRGRARDVNIIGTEDTFLHVRQVQMWHGRFFRSEEVGARRRLVVVGFRAAQEVFGADNPLGQELRVGGAMFRVIGVMAPRGVTLGIDLDDQVYIPITAAMELFGADSASSILLRARGRTSVADAVAEATALLVRRHAGQEDFTVISQDDLLSTLSKVMGALTGLLLGIASVSLLVSGIGIANIMLVSVTERTREIGVRRAVGARRRDILWQFLAESVMISLLGGGLGLLCSALLLGAARLLLPGLPVRIAGGTVALALGMSATVGAVAGLLPARRAARLDPVDALRGD